MYKLEQLNTKKVSELQEIAKDLNIQLAKMNNNYIGVVYTNQELSSDYISSIEKQFSKKFDVKLSLSQNVCDYDGIKVDIAPRAQKLRRETETHKMLL